MSSELNKKNWAHDDCHDDNCHCHDEHTEHNHHCHSGHGKHNHHHHDKHTEHNHHCHTEHTDNDCDCHDDDCSCHAHKHSSHGDGCGCGHDHGCGCGCEHDDDENLMPRLILGAVLFIAGMVLKNIDAVPYYINMLVFIASYAVLGYDVVFNAIKGILKGHMFNENFLMSIASIGAFLIGEQPEAVAVMLFYQVGEMLQDKAVDNSKKSIRSLMDLRPDYVSIEDEGKIKEVNPNDVKIGDIFVVKQGQRLALDGIVTDGKTYLDTSALTGESVPYHVGIGDEVLSGSINTGATIHVKATKEFSQSTVSKILDMVEHAQEKKSQSEKFITTFAHYYTPIVCALALLVMLIPSIVTGDVKTWLMRGLTFLVVSCPCALVISIPLGFFAGLGCASKNQVLIKGGNYLEMLSKLDTVVFDKTGTLTKGDFEVIKSSSDEALKTAAYAEFYSDHPIAKSIKSAFSENIDQSKISEYSELAGMGIQAKINGDLILAGNKRLMDTNNISVPQIDDYGTIIYVARDNKYLGYIVISDEVKESSKETVMALNRLGIKTVMLTGDKEKTALGVAKELNIKDVAYELLPQDKVAYLEKIINRTNGYTAFVGDGINDAPVLMRADIGIAMGGIGTDSAIDASDVVLMDDKPIRILKAIKISKHTLSIIRQNIIFALSIKVIIMILSTLGFANMWLAIFGDVGVALIAILNSMRALNVK